MGIDILNIRPNVISRDLASKFILLAGAPKVGKTEFCTTAPDSLILAFEIGTNARPGAFVQPIEKWSDFKLVVRQLHSDAAKEKYKTVAIDTIGIAYDACEAYICAQNSVQKVGDIPYGAGYKALSKEFDKTLREITMMGYGLLMTCHLKEKTLSQEENGGISSFSPDLNDRCLNIVNSLVDIIGVISQTWNEKGESTRYLITRASPTITAGSRYKYLDSIIPFGYKELEAAVGRALEKEAELNSAAVADHVEQYTSEIRNYNDIREEALSLWNQLVTSEEDEDKRALMARTIMKKAEIIFGRQIRLSEITEDQVDLYYLVLLEMRELVNKKDNSSN